jgi:arylsulfatase A-like enzyme
LKLLRRLRSRGLRLVCAGPGRVGALAALLLVAGCGASEPDPAVPTSPGDASAAVPAGALAAPVDAPADVPPTSRGVLLFVCDTLRADRLSCYGYERPTPGIDRLASLGTLFERNHAQGHWTLPSMMSMLTGLYVHVESEAIPVRSPTLAEWLSEEGVRTAAFVGNNVIGRERGFARGFDTFEIVADPYTRFEVLLDQFLAWHADQLRTRPGEPWFVWLHAMDPHAPYTPEPRDALYARTSTRPGGDELETRWRAASGLVARANEGRDGYLSDDEAVRRMVRRSNAYDGEVVAIDRGVARLLQELERRGVLDETAIVFAADHGEMLYEYPEYPAALADKRRRGDLANGLVDWFAAGHENWFYPELWRTPLIAIGPGFEPGVRTTALSANIDIFPTVLAFLGVEAPPVLDGRHLSHALERSVVYGYGRRTTAVLEASGLQLVDFAPGKFAERARQLLFDRTDSHLRDRARQQADDVTRLSALIDEWRTGRAFEANMDVPEITAHALRALGYAAIDEDGDTADGPKAEIPPAPVEDDGEDEERR